MDGLTRELVIFLDLPLMSKARPRFGSKGSHAYLPSKYRDWKSQCRDRLKAIWVEFDLPTLDSFELEIEAHGPGRCDADNLLGSILDAGLPDKATGWRGCWRDDRVTVVPSVSLCWIQDKNQYWKLRLKLKD